MLTIPTVFTQTLDLVPDWLFESPFSIWSDPQWMAVEVAAGIVIALAAKLFLHRKTRWRIKAANKTLRRVRRISGQHKQIAYLRKIDPFIFEELILTVMKRQGHRIKRNKRYTGDGGIDGQVWIRGKRHLIQAKRYSGYIRKSHLHEFDVLCKRHRCKGLFIHTGILGGGHECNETPRVKILDAERLLALL